MKDDNDLENLLRRYEPVGPSASLRARVVGARTSSRTWPWAAAAAALLALSVWLGASAERLMQRNEVDVAASQRLREVNALTEIIGDAENPRALAEWMIERRDADRALESPRQAVATRGAGR